MPIFTPASLFAPERPAATLPRTAEGPSALRRWSARLTERRYGLACASKGSTTSRASRATRRGNVDFYARVLGLRLVKKTVNQDDPTVYHLFYADEQGTPGPTSRSSSIRAPAAAAQAPGWCTRSPGGSRPSEALDFWERRLARRRAWRAARRTAGCASTTRRASGWSSPWCRPPTSRSSPSIPEVPARAGVAGLRQRARLRRRAGGEPGAAGGRAWRSPRRVTDAGRHAESSAAACYAYDPPPAAAPAFPAQAPCTTSRGRRRWRSTRRGGSASPQPACTRHR